MLYMLVKDIFWNVNSTFQFENATYKIGFPFQENLKSSDS